MIVEPCFQTFDGQTADEHAANMTNYLSAKICPDTGKPKCTDMRLYGMTPLAGDEKNFNPTMAAAEIAALADQRKTEGGNSGIAHWVVSWPVDERPTNEQMFAAAEKVVGKLGFDLSKTKAMMFIHDDKPHRHIHVEISRQHVDGFYTSMGLSQDNRFSVLAGRKAGAEVAHEMGFRPLRNGTYQIVDGVAVRQSKKRSLDDLSSNAIQEEKRTGQESYEKRLKVACAAAITAPGLVHGMGHEAFAAHFKAHGVDVLHKKGGLVYSLAGGRFMKASTLGSEISVSAMRQYFTPSNTARRATPETAPAVIAAATATASGQGWQIWHETLSAHGITAERQGGTSRDGGKVIFTFADGQKIEGAEIGFPLAGIEAGVGSTWRKAKKLRKTKTDAENSAPVDTAKPEAKTETDKPALVEAPKAETDKITEIAADKDAAAEGVKKLYEQGRALSEENRKRIDDYFRDSRIAKQLAAQVRKQGWNPATNEVLKQLRKSGKGPKTAEAAAIMAIAVLVKMIPVFLSDLSSFGNIASGAIERFKKDNAELRQHAEALQAREEKVKRIDPAKAERIYAAHRESLIDVWSRQKNDARTSDVLISAGIADRLRATGHNQSEIVEILKHGGEESSMAELSGYYAFSEKGDATYEKHKKYVPTWAKLERDACTDDKQKQRNAQNSRNNGQQSRNIAQNAQKKRNNNMNM